jgi:small subunit ribosomal protein S1
MLDDKELEKDGQETPEEQSAESTAETSTPVEEVVEETKEAAEAVVEKAEEVAEEVVEAATEKVEEAVEAAEEVAEAATEKAEEVTEVVAEKVEEATTKESSDEDEDEDEDDGLDEEPVIPETAHDDFDWAIGKKAELPYSESEIQSYTEQYESTLSSVIENEIVKGRVTSINDGDVVLDINFKSDGLVSLSEFRDTPDLAVGDTVDVYVEQQEDARGQLILSRRKAKLLRAWETSLTLTKMVQLSKVSLSVRPKVV